MRCQECSALEENEFDVSLCCLQNCKTVSIEISIKRSFVSLRYIEQMPVTMIIAVAEFPDQIQHLSLITDVIELIRGTNSYCRQANHFDGPVKGHEDSRS